jgi:hypothetical protein
MSPFKWLPISSHLFEPSRWTKEFVSDAAGLAAQASWQTKPGCGNVGIDMDGTVIFANQFIWPSEFIRHKSDEHSVRYGDKTTTLETIGLIIPLLLVPELLVNQHVRFMVDCLGTVFGMHNKAAKGDETASVFIRAAYLIAGFLGCTLHVQHLPRVSDWGALVSDRLSRESTTTRQDKNLIDAFHNRKLPQCLLRWFQGPSVDYGLATQLLEHVERIINPPL